MLTLQNVSFSLFLGSYVLYVLGVTLPLVHIRGTEPSNPAASYLPNEFEDETRNLHQSLHDLWVEQEYLPFVLIIFFSVCVPIIKLILCGIAYIRGRRALNAATLSPYGGETGINSESRLGRVKDRFCQILTIRNSTTLDSATEGTSLHNPTADLACSLAMFQLLRMISKYQLVDAYVVLFMMAFLNENLVSTDIKGGARFFLTYCILSVLATHLLYHSFAHSGRVAASGSETTTASGCRRFSEQSVDPSPLKSDNQEVTRQDSVVASRTSTNENLKTVYLFTPTCLMIISVLLVFTVANTIVALQQNKVLRVSVVIAEKSFIVDGHSYSIGEVISSIGRIQGVGLVSRIANSCSAAALLYVFAFVVPCFQLASIIGFQICSLEGLKKFKWSKMVGSVCFTLSDGLSDWAMGDVYAVGLLTTYVSLNAIPTIMATVPSNQAPDFVFAALGSNTAYEMVTREWRLIGTIPGFWASMIYGVCVVETQAHARLVQYVNSKRSERALAAVEGHQDPPPSCSTTTAGTTTCTSRDVSLNSTPLGTSRSPGPCSTSSFSSSTCAVRGEARNTTAEEGGPPDMGGGGAVVVDGGHEAHTGIEMGGRRTLTSGTWWEFPTSVCASAGLVVVKLMGLVALAVTAMVWNSEALKLQWRNTLDLSVMNEAFGEMISSFNNGLSGQLPASFGNCSDPQPIATGLLKHVTAQLAPKPCIGDTPIYYSRTTSYEVLGRWLTGLNTAQLNKLQIGVATTNSTIGVPAPSPSVSPSASRHHDSLNHHDGDHNEGQNDQPPHSLVEKMRGDKSTSGHGDTKNEYSPENLNVDGSSDSSSSSSSAAPPPAFGPGDDLGEGMMVNSRRLYRDGDDRYVHGDESHESRLPLWLPVAFGVPGQSRLSFSLNSRHLESINATSPSDVSVSRLTLSVEGTLKELNLSLRIGECLSPDVWVTKKCDTLWDNTDSCCGNNVTFHINATAECHDGFPYLRNPEVNSINVSKLVVKERIIFGKQYDFQDITQSVIDEVTSKVTRYVSAKSGDVDASVLYWGGRPLVLVDVLNQLIFYNYPEVFKCPVSEVSEVREVVA
eukprot:GHVN01089341.1.p1 GENE.GHVN01089341.1~~GHVN01089341.1.p1  ORF type:complete len:1071 (+),score=130.63 GHVN01089341.1:153-3365(+)